MSDSEIPAPARVTGKRTVNGLTASQIQHKRDLDRKAQRALRQRTKLRIQELENDIARFRASFSQREQTMIDEIHLLRDQNRKLKCSLENIQKYALGELSGLGETIPPHDTPDREIADKEIEQFPSHSLQPGEDTIETQSTLTHQPFQSDHDVYLSVSQAMDPNDSNPTHNHESDRPTLPPLAGAFAGLVAENDAHPHQQSYSNQLTPLGNLRTTHDPVSPSVSPGSVAWVLPKHTCATCPLDQILLDFIASRRSMLARGIPPDIVLGPEQLCPQDLLHPTVDLTSHAISRVMADVLTTFPHVNLPEKLAFMYLMHLTTRWQVSPNIGSYARMPVWLRPTVTQITVPHAAWIDNIPWPRVRDILIQKPDRYPFAVFSELYSEHVSINWPYDPEDIVVDTDDGPSLNTIFEKHIQRLSNWIAPRQFREYFSEWTSDVYVDE
ncbi:hypothetical protein N7517_009646 [Penicillium concentricum]|uniref:BZIP domain-containing protein n=1 Tax=Penicillium concentricum TaxID=293559 RepID=A0A9W9RHT4_9EURO|nr:uncharacterized protein N7517_009646 [Penicillium concentricum]KAJ5360455.1 hypothetical protein N7517_009646 [Penicillium concentricum]